MTRLTDALRTHRPSWPAVLLFTALLAQAPHAAAVFIRIAPHGAQWEIATSFVGAWVYAIALEGATAYFVWRSKLRWAVAFAAFSVAHNVAYYMPEAWTFDVYGATLSLRYVFSAILISMSLPIAIAAFSHVQADASQLAPEYKPAKATGRPQKGHTAAVMGASTNISLGEETEANVPTSDGGNAPTEPTEPAPAKLTPAQRRAQIREQEITDAAQIAAQFGVKLRTAQEDLRLVREAMTQQNGVH